MEILIDKNKLRTAKTYAKDYDYSVQYVYRLIKEKRLKTVNIDGVTFIKV